MKFRFTYLRTAQSGFTLMEIAISLAIIGIALVAIIGVLPLGLHTQGDNREKNIIDQDATVFMETISKGAAGFNDLTNYVYAITNESTSYIGGSAGTTTTTGYDSTYLTSGARIVGLMSTPQFTDASGNPIYLWDGNGNSNHIIAYVRSLSGLVLDKPPQDNQLMQQNALSYHLYCLNAPVAGVQNNNYGKQLGANLHEIRLVFRWPIYPNGKVGAGYRIYRATIAGQISVVTNLTPKLYFYQNQSFAAAP